MVDIETLKYEIKESGMSMVAIAEKSGMVKATLYNRLNGLGEFSSDEMIAISNTLHFSKDKRDKIFLKER